MAVRPISTEIYTTSHRILGRIIPGTMGLFSYLNIRTTSFVEVEGAHLNRLHQPAKLVARYPEIWLVKNEIVAILVSRRPELGPASGTPPRRQTTIQRRADRDPVPQRPGRFASGALQS